MYLLSLERLGSNQSDYHEYSEYSPIKNTHHQLSLLPHYLID